MAIRAPKTNVPEVRCSSCQVSFPPEVKRCMHCGGRTHRPDELPRVVPGGAKPLRELEPFVVGEAPPASRGERPRPIDEPDDVDELEGPGRSPLRVVSAVVWILLALAGGLYRACSG
ncbi:MAG: hypothetical protein ACQGVK_14765 [Myxococcota bacterium]